ncbi:MAG: tetratricopeptide repeat protein, partial [Bacteroidota bacterium]
LSKALEYFEDETKLFEELYRSFPDNVSLKHGLAISYEKLGTTHSSLGNLNKALEYFEDEATLMQVLYHSYPDNVSLKNGLAISYEKLGSTHSSLDNLSKALKYFEERNRLSEELYRSYPDTVSLKNGLAISYWKLGDFYREKQKDSQHARHYFQLAEQQWSELVELAPDYARFKQYLERVKSDLADLA